jgi:hypothetical protein
MSDEDLHEARAGEGESPSGFFPLERADRWTLAVLVVYTVVAFLPWWREVEVGGMALFGWLMAGLMVLSPVLALVRLRARRGGRL